MRFTEILTVFLQAVVFLYLSVIVEEVIDASHPTKTNSTSPIQCSCTRQNSIKIFGDHVVRIIIRTIAGHRPERGIVVKLIEVSGQVFRRFEIIRLADLIQWTPVQEILGTTEKQQQKSKI